MMVIPKTHRTGQKGFSDYDGVDAAKNVFSSRNHAEPARRQQAGRYPARAERVLAPRWTHPARLRAEYLHAPPLWLDASTLRPARLKFNDFKGAHQVYLARGQGNPANAYADPARAYPEVMAVRGGSSKYKNSH